MIALVLPIPETCAFCEGRVAFSVGEDDVVLGVCRNHIADALEWDHAWDGVA